MQPRPAVSRVPAPAPHLTHARVKYNNRPDTYHPSLLTLMITPFSWILDFLRLSLVVIRYLMDQMI